jgi:putative membrane protein insertion efficiency factor
MSDIAFLARKTAALPGRILALPLLALIRLYQWFLSPLMGHACRFTPSCSHYGYEAIATHGPLLGAWLAVKRVVRCHPWGGSGLDPVPPRRAR